MRLMLTMGVLLTLMLVLLASCNKGDSETTQTQAPDEPAATQASAAPAGQDAAAAAVATPTSWTGDAINFSFTTADGEVRTADSYAGKPLVLNFWAAW